MARLRDRVSLLDERNRAENDILFNKASADTKLARQLNAFVEDAGHAIDNFSRDRAAWPAWLGMVQGGGLSKWDPFVRLDLALPLVDERLTTPLRDAGLDRGWTTHEIPVYDKKWHPVATHRALIVAASVERATADGFDDQRHEVAVRAESLPEAELPPLAWVDGTHVLIASPAASAVLEAAKLPGLALQPIRGVRGAPS